MYCPKCKVEVSTQRDEINWVLLVILAIFTAGFGVLIYLAYYFNKPENKCIHCNSICQDTYAYASPPSTVITPSIDRNNNSTQITTEVYRENDINESNDITRYCPSCGSKLGDREGGNFCPYCGFSFK